MDYYFNSILLLYTCNYRFQSSILDLLLPSNMEQSSLEERRQLNIQRNQEFLRQLFASQVEPDPLKSAKEEEERTFSQKRPAKRNFEEISPTIDLIGRYPQRSQQIYQLHEYFTIAKEVKTKLYYSEIFTVFLFHT
jgi:hypothetical protein